MQRMEAQEDQPIDDMDVEWVKPIATRRTLAEWWSALPSLPFVGCEGGADAGLPAAAVREAAPPRLQRRIVPPHLHLHDGGTWRLWERQCERERRGRGHGEPATPWRYDLLLCATAITSSWPSHTLACTPPAITACLLRAVFARAAPHRAIPTSQCMRYAVQHAACHSPSRCCLACSRGRRLSSRCRRCVTLVQVHLIDIAIRLHLRDQQGVQEAGVQVAMGSGDDHCECWQ